jgi:hypothetical protein
MMTKKELLAKETYKQDGLDIAKRVFLTLDGKHGDSYRDSSRIQRNSKAIGQLFKTLHKSGQLSDDDLDKILIEVIS